MAPLLLLLLLLRLLLRLRHYLLSLRRRRRWLPRLFAPELRSDRQYVHVDASVANADCI